MLRLHRLNFGMPGGRQVFREFCIGKPATLNPWGNSYQDEIGLIAVTFLEWRAIRLAIGVDVPSRCAARCND